MRRSVVSQQEIPSHHVTTRASCGQHGQWLNTYSALTHSAWIRSYGQSKELCLISIIDSWKMIQSIFRICRGHEKRRWSRLPPSPNTYCPDKHLHLTISTLTVASSQKPSLRKVSHENMCPIVQSRPECPSQSGHRQILFSGAGTSS